MGPLSPSAAVAPRSTSLEIAAALCYLHTKDILHGDLCSGNILLSAASRDRRGFVAKVADFGLSRSISATVTTATYGTVSIIEPSPFSYTQLLLCLPPSNVLTPHQYGLATSKTLPVPADLTGAITSPGSADG